MDVNLGVANMKSYEVADQIIGSRYKPTVYELKLSSIDLDSSFSFAWTNLGVLLKKRKKIRQAEEYFKKAVMLDKKNHISILTIDHPPVNAINLAAAQEFEQALWLHACPGIPNPGDFFLVQIIRPSGYSVQLFTHSALGGRQAGLFAREALPPLR